MNHKFATLVFLAGMTLAGQAQASSGVYERTLQSAVLVWNTEEGCTGSGALIDEEQRLIVTNYHVVGEADEVHIMFPRFRSGTLIAERSYYERTWPAIVGRVVVRDRKRDLALVQIDTVPDGAKALPLASQSAKPGQQIHSIGNPGASAGMWVYTSGTVRQVYHSHFRCEDMVIDARIVETQSPTNPGDSGGPAVNDSGELVGIVQSQNTGARSMSTFVDVEELRELLRDGPKPLHDPEAEHRLTASGIEFVVDDEGDFRVDIYSADGVATVFVKSVPTIDLLGIHSQVYVGPELPDALVMASLMQQVSQYPLGKCLLTKSNDSFIVLFTMGLSRQETFDELPALVEMAGRATLELRQSMQDAH